MEALDTIAAIATPPGTGGIGVIRISGPAAIPIAQRMFLQRRGQPLQHVESHHVYHGFVVNAGGECIDEALLCIMQQPRSYTREDVAEISCHGGRLITQQVLDTALAQGARVAEPGEFTKRAFLNGRIDLTQAEAVIDLIQARTVASQRAAFAQLEGALSRQLHALREQLLQVSMYLEASIDFPEEDIELVSAGGLIERLALVGKDMVRLVATFSRGRVMREGLAVAIVGRPNVGKSSLLNALVGRDRAIVSPHPGTTRDTIEVAFDLGGLLIRIIDTAGVRTTADALEQEGVRRTREAIAQAELLIVVLDGSAALTEDDFRLLAETASKPRVLVHNKCDLAACWSWHDMSDAAIDSPLVAVSALHGHGLPDLERAVVQQGCGQAPGEQDEVLLTHARHHQSLLHALYTVQAAEQGLRHGTPVEFVAFDVMEGLRHIGDVLGESCSGEVLERIFSHFCIGK